MKKRICFAATVVLLMLQLVITFNVAAEDEPILENGQKAYYYIDDSGKLHCDDGENDTAILEDYIFEYFYESYENVIAYAQTSENEPYELLIGNVDEVDYNKEQLVAELMSVTGKANETTIYNFLKNQMGLNTAGACGVLANIQNESSFNPNVYGDSGTSYGICQWHDSRFTAMKNWCSSNGYDYTTLTGQLYYLKHELSANNSAYLYNGKTIYNKLAGVSNTADGAYSAGYDWCYYYEVPADTDTRANARGVLARDTYWAEYGDTGTTLGTTSGTTTNHPYPQLLDYTDLDSSFSSLASAKILPQYRNYVLSAIKYHIESSYSDYRVCKNLLQLYTAGEDGNVVFFFDGCSINLDGATYGFSGYYKNGTRYNTSAVCIVLKLNSNGRPEIVYASANASTMADNVRNASLNGGTDVSITKDGIYNLKTTNHKGYAALNIGITDGASLRCPSSGSSYSATASGINIHARSWNYVSDSTYGSTGCFNVGDCSTYTDYNNFIYSVYGVSNARNVALPQNGVSSWENVGIVIIDRYNYKSQLATIFGNDNSSSGMSGEQIASAITAASQEWSEGVLGRVDTEVSAADFNYHVDIVTGGVNSVYVSGWAYDENDISEGLNVLIYIGGAAGTGPSPVIIPANVLRTDVNEMLNCGEYHGFEENIHIQLTGEQYVYLYLVNPTTGANIDIGEYKINIEKDVESPQIIEAEIIEKNSEYYKIRFTVTDNCRLRKVYVYDWTVNNEQDDMISTEYIVDGTGWTIEHCVYYSDHNNEINCDYFTHIYVYDYNENSSYHDMGTILAIYDTEAPQITDFEVKRINQNEFTISCNVSDNVGLQRVSFPVWSENNGQDDIVWYETTAKNGKASIIINIENHKSEYGAYVAEVYAWDICGNKSSLSGWCDMTQDNEPPNISNVEIIEKTSNTYTIQCIVEDNVSVAYVDFPTWTLYNGQDDLDGKRGTMNGNVVTCTIDSAIHNNENGSYFTEIHAYDCAGNMTKYIVGVVELTVTYTVDFDPNGGINVPSSQSKVLDEDLIITTQIPVKEGYTFKGWATTSTGTVAYAPGSTYTANADVTLYAVWEENAPEVDETAPQIIVNTAKARPGSTVEVTLEIKNNPGIAGMGLSIDYDEGLTLKSVTAGDALSNLDLSTAKDITVKPFRIGLDGTDADDSDGVFAILTFEVAEDAEEGDYSVEISYNKGDIYDDDTNDVDVTVVNGTVTVSNAMTGDLSGDETINFKDVTLLRRRILGGYGVEAEDSVCDINKDGAVNFKDVTLMRRFILGGYGVEIDGVVR